MRTIALAFLLAACGGSDKPAPATPDPESGETPVVMTAEECEAAGGTVAWDPGDGSGQCEAGFFEAADVSGGDEGGLCCQPMPDAAE